MYPVCIPPKIDHSELQDYFELAKQNPLYIEFYKGNDFAAGAPVLSKKELMPILETKFKLEEEKTGVYLVRSGGSTQKPLVFPVDIQENHNQRLALAGELTRNNFFTSKTIALNIFGYSDMYRTAAIMDDILEKCQATTLALSAHASYADMEQAARHFKPDFIFGTPSKLICFAHFLQKNNRQIEIGKLFYAGEFLRPNTQKFLQQVLGFQEVYSMYGSAETGIWAWSHCTKTPSLFSVIKGIIVEIINPDEEGYGTIAVTNTFRKRFPVFRYAIGDIGRWVELDGKSFLELKSREAKSFIVCEQHYDLDKFLSFTSEATAFQIQLSTNKNFKDVVKMLIVQNVSEDKREAFVEEKDAALKKLLNYEDGFMDVEVLLVTAADLYIDPNTTKTPVLLDRR
ncbi:phenylacetate--CoA ligase family protein [Flavobacterium tructae]|uniref:Phenylacetate--CoA ligase family protein n=1 Tax=Flavobacterium tructae TaxID=1114873 RepID=A0A1S1J5G7_9FLAO|nr:AMP-binding protein [Flavobacterium tructae]OHT44729.1 hypothetical protein BHE19_13550 [Flavobacterium tructae]OXB19132.1 hypothetical protein B0A71_11315 [Flavobacterium tructae]